MPRLKVKGKMKKFSYDKAGKKAYKKARKKKK